MRDQFFGLLLEFEVKNKVQNHGAIVLLFININETHILYAHTFLSLDLASHIQSHSNEISYSI